MKNIGKIVGIIAILAVIGLMTGCELEADPDDQISITVSGLPSGANNLFTKMYLSTDGINQDVAVTSGARIVANGSSTNKMVFPEGHKNAGLAFGEEGDYKVILRVYDTENPSSTTTPKYGGYTLDKIKFSKGGNTVVAAKFSPTITNETFPSTTTPPPAEPSQDFWGTFTGPAYADNYIETIELTKTTFRVSDNEKTGANQEFLEFTIQNWASVDVPREYENIAMKGYKFTGIITNGKPISPTGTTQDPAIYGTGTAPGFTQADINTTVCHMYIFTNGSGGNYSLYRSVFSKETGTDSKAIVKTKTGDNRQYQRKTN